MASLASGITSLYWLALTGLIGLAVSGGGASPGELLVPIILIGLYAVRAVQIWKGNPTALVSALWLHGIGGLMSIVQMAKGDAIVLVLYGIKLLIHVAGGVTAFVARKAFLDAYRQTSA